MHSPEAHDSSQTLGPHLLCPVLHYAHWTVSWTPPVWVWGDNGKSEPCSAGPAYDTPAQSPAQSATPTKTSAPAANRDHGNQPLQQRHEQPLSLLRCGCVCVCTPVVLSYSEAWPNTADTTQVDPVVCRPSVLQAVRSACFSIGWDQPCKEDDAVDVDVYIFGLDKNQKCFAVLCTCHFLCPNVAQLRALEGLVVRGSGGGNM